MAATNMTKIRFADYAGDVHTVNIEDVELRMMTLASDIDPESSDENMYNVMIHGEEIEISYVTYEAITDSIDKITVFISSEVPDKYYVSDVVTHEIMKKFPGEADILKIVSETQIAAALKSIKAEISMVLSRDCFDSDTVDTGIIDSPINALYAVWKSNQKAPVTTSTPAAKTTPIAKPLGGVTVKVAKPTTVVASAAKISASPNAGIPTRLS